MFNSTSPSLADIAAVTGRNNEDGFGGGWWILIILFAIFGGWGNNGYGNNGNNGVGAEVQRGFDTQSIISKLDGITNGLCDGFYATNNTIQQTGFGIQQAINADTVANMQNTNAIQSQLAECCCENRAAIAQVRYDMATDTCAITTALERGFNSVNENVNKQFCDLQMRDMQRTIDEQASLIQSLNLAQSQANQNQTLINALRPSPVPAYQVANPFAGYGYGCCGQNTGCCAA